MGPLPTKFAPRRAEFAGDPAEPVDRPRGVRRSASIPLGALRFQTFEGGPFVLRFDPRSSEEGTFALLVALSGTALVRHGVRTTALRPGRAVAVDDTVPLILEAAQPSCVLLVRCPVVAVWGNEKNLPSPAGTICDSENGPIEALVISHLVATNRQLSRLSPQDARSVSTVTVRLLSMALAHHSSAPADAIGAPNRSTLRASIVHFIDENLTTEDLSVGSVAQAHHVSVRYVQQMFHDDGHTVSNWIRDRRLESCKRDLADPVHECDSVRTIAIRWCIGDPAYFSRVFKARYGSTPTAFRRANNALNQSR